MVGAAPFASEVLGRLESAEALQHESAGTAQSLNYGTMQSPHSTVQLASGTAGSGSAGNSTAGNSTDRGTARHLERMRAVAARLLQDECFTASSPSDRATAHCWTPRPQQRRKPFVLLASGILLDQMLGRELQRAITTRGAKLLLASMDAGFASLTANMKARARPLLISALTIPYWAHQFAAVEEAPSETPSSTPSNAPSDAPSDAAVAPQRSKPQRFEPQGSTRHSGVLFHGGTRRFDFEVRARTEAVLRALIRRAHNMTPAGHATPPVDLRVSEMTRGRGNDQLTSHWECVRLSEDGSRSRGRLLLPCCALLLARAMRTGQVESRAQRVRCIRQGLCRGVTVHVSVGRHAHFAAHLRCAPRRLRAGARA